MKIGVAIIACDRQDYTAKCAESVAQNSRDVQEIILVNDGGLLPKSIPGVIKCINNDPPYQSVGYTKNRALSALLESGCTDIFLIENDIIVKSPDVYMKYIHAAKVTGIQHLNYGYHGPANRTPDYKSPNPRVVIDYGSCKIALNPHSVGAFSYYTKHFIETVGTHDLHFKNAWEHVEVCQRAVEKGYLPAFWWFPDIPESWDMLDEIPQSIKNSSITHTPEWTANMQKGAAYYEKLHGHAPVHTPDTSFDVVRERLKNIHKKYKCT